MFLKNKTVGFAGRRAAALQNGGNSTERDQQLEDRAGREGGCDDRRQPVFRHTPLLAIARLFPDWPHHFL